VRGNPALDYLGEGIVELLSTKLDRVGDLRTVDPRALLSAAREREGELSPDAARDLAERFGAARYVLGSVIQLGDSVRLSAALYDPTGNVQATAESVAREVDLGRAVDDVARLLLGRMSATPADRLESIGAITTASYPALRAYLDGQRAFRGGQLDSAIIAFRRATELDTAFALAWYRLATAAVWNDQDSLWYQAMDRAIRHEERLSARDRALLDAQHAWRLGRVVEAERQYDAITRAHPDDQEAWFWLGDIRLHTNFLRGRPLSEAEPALRRALALNPREWQTRGHLDWLLRRTERPAAADSVDTPPDTAHPFYPFVRRDRFRQGTILQPDCRSRACSSSRPARRSGAHTGTSSSGASSSRPAGGRPRMPNSPRRNGSFRTMGSPIAPSSRSAHPFPSPIPP
jgi:tetratricopeptide (TPR) repeat protein